MNPYRLLRYAHQILSFPKNEVDAHLRWCAKMTRFGIISMTIVSITTLVGFIWFGWGQMHLWERTVDWNEKGGPLIFNTALMVLAMPATMFLLAMILLFSQHTSHHGRMVLIASGEKVGD